MKLAISALVLLGLSQVCSAVSTFDVGIFPPSDDLNYNYFCTSIRGCVYPCKQISGQEAVFYTSGLVSDRCRFPDGSSFPPIAAFESIFDNSVLNHIEFYGDETNYACEYHEETSGGSIYRCSLPSVFEFVTTTTTTTTTTATTTATTTTAGITTTGTTTTTTTTGTTSSSTTTALPVPTCLNKDTIFAKKRGNGYNGDCCKTEADCLNECIKGKCNGPKKATTTTKKSTATTKKSTATTTKKATTSTTTTTKKPTQTPAVCKSGYLGKKKGNGSKGACCTTHWDCKEECIKGSCN